MRLRALAALLLLAVAAQDARAWDFSSVASFRKTLADKETTLVAFLAPSTEASRKLETDWSAVDDNMAGAKLAIDCLSEQALCAELDVVSFPTIRLYRRDGPMSRYKGARKSAEIQGFLRRMARPTVTDLEAAITQAFSTSDHIVVVGQVPEFEPGAKDDIRLEDRFRALAAQYRDRFSFGLSRVPTSEPALVQCYNNVDGSSFRTAELAHFGALEAFVKKCAAPLIPELTRRNEGEYLKPGKSLVYFFSPAEIDRKTWVDKARPLARKYAEFLTFVTVDSAAYPEMVSGLGVPGGAAGAGVSVSNPGMGQVFALPGTESAPTVEAVEQFIVAISQGQVQPWDGQLREDSGAHGPAEGHDEL